MRSAVRLWSGRTGWSRRRRVRTRTRPTAAVVSGNRIHVTLMAKRTSTRISSNVSPPASGGKHARAVVSGCRTVTPEQPIRVMVLGARGDWLPWPPVDDDVVVNLRVTRNLGQHDRAFAPIAKRLDP